MPSRLAIALALAVPLVSAHAQVPPAPLIGSPGRTPLVPPPPPLPKPAAERLQRFDPRALTVTHEGSHWVLRAGPEFLKDFGSDQSAANAAAKLLRRLQINQHGIVGTRAVVLDYWLSDGRPPEYANILPGEVPFDLASLTVDPSAGTWQLRDGATVLLDFGDDPADAALALAVCKRHGFNRLGTIGTGRPLMAYLIADGRTAPGFAPETPGRRDRLVVLPQRFARQPLTIPGKGVVGDVVPCDGRRLEARKGADGDWIVESDGYELERFGRDEKAAAAAVRLLTAYGVTEQCRVGSGSTEVRFYLCRGRPAHGVRSGMTARPLPPDRVRLEEVGGSTELRCDRVPVFSFGEDREAGERLLAVMRHFGFDAVAEDRSTPSGLRMLVRQHGD